MIVKYLIFIIVSTTAVLSAPKDLRLLFPQDKQYVYEITATLSSGTLNPREATSSWTLEGRLSAQVLGNESQVRFQLGDLKTSVNSEHDGYISYQLEEAAADLKLPWVVDYFKEFCLVEAVYLPAEPAWVSNIKRALSLNFQLKNGEGYYTNYEACIQDYSCFTTYLSKGNTLTKYTSLPSSPKLGASWTSVPWTDPLYKYDQYLWNSLPDITTMTAERVYRLDERSGLQRMEMKGQMKYRAEGLTLFVNTELDIQFEAELPPAKVDWPKLTRTEAKYAKEDCEDPSCGIKETSQGYLKNRTYEILLKISRKGIDADNVVKDPTMVHSIDFINLLNTISLLNYTSLKVLFEDLVLGTSYELETSRNIFLEVLPYAGTEDAVRFVKFLVVEEASKIEDSALLSLVRKLPFNNANYSQHLLEQLEPFTRLGLDFPQELRHAAILAFSTMLHQARRGNRVSADYFDSMAVKYLRMYSDCPHYMDRLVWLQGLCNIGSSVQKYTMEIFTDASKKRNERLWAAFASDYIDNQYYISDAFKVTETILPVLMNETENIQIRIASLHSFLASTSITQNDFQFVHNYVQKTGHPQLKRFWSTALKSLELNRNFDGYKLASLFLPSVSDLVFDLDPDHWATNNIVFRSDDDPSTSMHLISMADETGLPAFAGVRLGTGGKRASVYIVAEGIASNIYKRMHRFDETEMDVDNLINVLKDLKVWATKTPEEVHIDLVFKINEKAVYVAHMNQSRCDSWNVVELAKSVTDFLRLGSHINQQIVYCPAQMELLFPNELGIPVRLQTTSVSFTSVRGNLTAPATDIHIRYQGMFLTSLSTFGPLVQSEHSARIQKSMVAHLPIKFNISHTPVGVYNLKTDFILPIQNGGVVIHTRTQVEKNTRDSVDLYTVTSQDYNQSRVHSIFSDCETSAYDAKLQNLFTRNIYNIFMYLHPSKLILRSLPLAISPPSSTCAVIHFHNVAIFDINRGVKATLLIENLPSIVEFFSGEEKVLKTRLLLKDYRQDTEVAGEIVNFEIGLVIRNLDKSIVTRLDFNSSADARVYIENNDILSTEDDHRNLDAIKTHISAGYRNKDVDSSPTIDLYIETEKGDGEKRIAIKFLHDLESVKHSLMMLLHIFCDVKERRDVQLPQDMWVPLYFACISESTAPPFSEVARSTEIAAVLKNGLTSVMVTNGSHMRLRSPEITWWVDNWITLKKMTTFGFYRECRIEGSTLRTLTGNAVNFKPTGETVVLADCTELPRFAVLLQRAGGLTVYAGGHSVSVRIDNGAVTSTSIDSFFRIQKLGKGVKIQSTGNGVQVYFNPDGISILVPNSHVQSICGVCVGS